MESPHKDSRPDMSVYVCVCVCVCVYVRKWEWVSEWFSLL